MFLLFGTLLFAAQRAILWRAYAQTPIPRVPFADPVVYVDLARTWAEGNPMPAEAVFHTPLYPYLVGLSFRAFSLPVRTPWFTQLADWHNWGVMSSQAQMPTEAEHAYRKALELDPAHRETLENLSYNLLMSERYAEAEQFLSTLVEAHPDSVRGQTRMALARLARGDARGAEAFARRALALAPGEETARRALDEALRLQYMEPIAR